MEPVSTTPGTARVICSECGYHVASNQLTAEELIELTGFRQTAGQQLCPGCGPRASERFRRPEPA